MSNFIQTNMFNKLFLRRAEHGLSTPQTVAVVVFVALLMIPIFTSILDISKTAQQSVQETEKSAAPTMASSYSPAATSQRAARTQSDHNVLYDTGGKRKCYDPPMTKECGATLR